MTGGRYTVSRHDAPGGAHWDLFLEHGDVLRTWRLSAPPETGDVTCEALPDHRAVYLDYEGPISGGRGTVAVHSKGVFALAEASLVLTGGLSGGAYRFEDDGKRLCRTVCQGPA